MDPLCETKPIARSGAPRRCLNCGLWIADCGLGTALQPAASGLRRAKCAKQTQFPPDGIPHHSTMLSFHHSNPMPIVQNEPNLEGYRAGAPDRPRADCAKQSQTCAGWGIWGIAAPGRGDCTKRTQFPATPAGTGPEGTRVVGCGTNEANSVARATVRNKANCRRKDSQNSLHGARGVAQKIGGDLIADGRVTQPH